MQYIKNPMKIATDLSRTRFSRNPKNWIWHYRMYKYIYVTRDVVKSRPLINRGGRWVKVGPKNVWIGIIWDIFWNDPGRVPRQMQMQRKWVVYCNMKAPKCFRTCFLGETALFLAEDTSVTFAFVALYNFCYPPRTQLALGRRPWLIII